MVSRLAKQARQTCLLQRDVVVVVQVVETHNLVPALHKGSRDMGTDEAGRAGDQNFH